ncbi:hypothetical protein [Chitinophaga ginsengisoli]|uniref:Uncharacterized protein n=1 Tax=Chitinophaga ginsengisoli TaxID=363837 RepID=A0A2P8G131_9BACT|nr:hypothetical protein [Chitinophaga ginsengisoli]PSL27674.1 hypothetical protein CLV42_109211 [Chitinophaga ginsengisoli]
MARQKGILPFTGPLGDRVGYRRNGEYFTRKRPLYVRQTAATKLAAKDFGTASKGAALLRRALYTELHRYYDSDLIPRLNKTLAGIMCSDRYYGVGERRLTVSNMQVFEGFRFNVVSGHEHLLSGTPVIREDERGVHVDLSESTVYAPKGVTHFTIKAMVVSANFERSAAQVVASETITIKKGAQLTAATLSINAIQDPCAARKGIRIVLLEVQPCIQVNGELSASANKQGYALDVIAVLPPVEQVEKMRREYKNKAPMLKIIPVYPGYAIERFDNVLFVKDDVIPRLRTSLLATDLPQLLALTDH